MNQNGSELRQETIQKGRLSRIVYEQLAVKAMKREHTVIKLMVADFRNGKLTHEGCLAYAAKISELRALLDDFEREVKSGMEAAEKEFDHG